VESSGTLIENLLKSFGLSSYSRKMFEFGYDSNIKKLKSLNQVERDNLYDMMKVFPGHRARFNTMIEMLKCVVEDCDLNSTQFTQHTQHTDLTNHKVYRKDKRPRTSNHMGRNPSQGKISEKTVRDSMNVKSRIKELSC